ncbi:MAG: hypothetical protein HWN68_10710 [Desulfobacterales bacterium]|nr:hypothetical protein [Desulfobacterales bacterium]
MYGLRIKILLLSLLIVVFHRADIYAWECSVTLEGPNAVKVGQTITLSASGAPEGGSYSWSNTPNLVPNGSTAQLTGFVPSFSDYILVTVTYTSPRGKKCSDTKGIWVCICNVKISGPTQVKVGEIITLTAEGDPSGGTYAWAPLAGLVPSGSSAQFTGQTPGDVTIEVIYTALDEVICTDTHAITVSAECSVTISGPSQVALGDTIDLTASGSPVGGTYSWSPLAGLVASGSTAQFTCEIPGDITIKVTYTNPDGETCTGTHTVTAFGVGSITGPVCVESGTTLTKDDFTIITNPTGFEALVTVSPLTFSTLLQSEEVTLIASCGPGAADDATTTIIVVNGDLRIGFNIDFKIPNYLNDILEKIALGDKTDLSVGCSFEDFKECCGFGVATSAGGIFTGNLSIDAGPFTIIGIPLPPKVKKYVAADLLNASLAGEGSVGINGSYKACEDTTNWSGGGDLTAGVKLGGELTIHAPYDVIVLEQEISGSTSISEELSTDLMDLKIATNCGGLTGTITATIKIIWFKTPLSFSKSRTYFDKSDIIPPVIIPLPSLK